MAREVRFCVTCADTRLGQHLRVVGSSKYLGEWTPQRSPPLTTSAGDFPLWRTTGFVTVAEDEPVEYKYVICDNDGCAIRWEERPNRSLHFAPLASCGICPPRGFACSLVEVFNGCEAPDAPSRFCGLERERSNSVALLRMRSAGYPEREHPPALSALDATDLFQPTMRERCPSQSMLVSPTIAQQAAISMTSQRSSSLLYYGQTAAEQTTPPEVTNGYMEEEPQATDTGMMMQGAEGGLSAVPSAAGSLGGLFREESCSNIFLYDTDNEEADLHSREFEQRYALVGQGPLGEGTFGLVWRCVPKGLSVNAQGHSQENAAKIVRKSRLQPRDMRYLLGEDGEVATHLTMKHPNIVELLEFFDEPQSVTLVLEFCRGGDLFDAIITEFKSTRRGFTEQAAAVATQHVLSALAYVHGQSVVHRDVKCENVLLAHVGIPAEENVFKLCDFGFAAHDRGNGFSDRLGSPDTVAPEVVAGSRYTFPADLWSAGTLVYMMLSAQSPFCAPADSDVLRKVRAGNYSLAGPLWDTISAPPKHVITSLMTVDAKLRPNAKEALEKAWLKNLPVLAAT